MANLAAIVEEGEKRHAEATSLQGMSAYMRWLAEHHAALLAVVKAALRVQSDLDDCSTAPLTIEAVEALRAAVLGEEEKKG